MAYPTRYSATWRRKRQVTAEALARALGYTLARFEALERKGLPPELEPHAIQAVRDLARQTDLEDHV